MRPFANALSPEQPRGRTAPDPERLAAPLPAARPEPLAELGLVSIGDVLETLPFRFEDFSTVRALDDLVVGEEATVLVRVGAIAERPTSRRNLRIVSVAVTDARGGSADVVWFNQRYLARTLEPGMLLLVRGEARAGRRGFEVAARSHEILATAAEAAAGDAATPQRLVPVYRASSRVSSRVVRAVAEAALLAVDAVGDPLPPGLRVDRRLPLRRDALVAGHRPRSEHEARVARRRLAYEELMLLQVALLEHRRTTAERVRARPLPAGGPLVAAYRAGLPFVLTGAQERALAAIDGDLGRPSPMQRLLQGDVGSGKTAVALAALVRAVEAGAQGALMAPTEVLAVQHAATAERLLGALGVERCLLTADVPKREQTARRQRIESGEPLIAIGTHALLNVAFHRLAVAVVDEQHRFGVEQRGGLGEVGAGEAPHVLHMTATPIPRSLALTLYGDLDVTVIDELPAGRQPVLTRIVPENRRAAGYEWIVAQVAAGRQAYIVCPLVEGSALVEARAAEEEAARLAAGPLAAVRVGCLHGQMRGPERLEGMRRFVAGDLDVLVATTVIEVGVDVANATIMVVEDADRFGLSQLHQLRGRVGRGAEASFCFLYESAEPSEEGRRRLQALVEHASGFELAEIDLEMRGEGHLLGQLQSGRSDFRHARLPRDRRLLERARADATAAIAAGLDPVLGAAADERFGALIAGMRRG